MQVFSGRKLHGPVDRVPGLFFVATDFVMLRGVIPVLPRGSYLVREGTEGQDAFLGERVPLSLRSVLLVYVRLFCAGVALSFGIIAGLMAGFSVALALSPEALDGRPTATMLWTIAAGVTIGCAYWKGMTAPFRFSAPCFLLLAIAYSLVGILVESLADPNRPNLQKTDRLLLEGPGILSCVLAVIYSLANVVTGASFERALAHAQTLNIPTELIEEHFRSKAIG